jgi:hypothetical protein
VCGGRTYSHAGNKATPEEQDRARYERELLISTLSSLGVTELAEGGAAGADFSAAHWARRNLVPHRSYPARWADGPSAGPERNKRMLREFKPDAVVAFPGGRGTADMVAQAREAGIKVIEVVA